MKRVKEVLLWIRGLFSPTKKENWRVVMLCLLAATTFWLLNALNKRYTTKISYPIEFLVDNPNAVVVVQELPSKVEIDVSGGGWNLLRRTIWFNVSPLAIPLNNPTEVKYIPSSSLVPLISEQLSDISLNYVITDTLKIDIEAKVSKTAHLRIDSGSINLAPSFRVMSEIVINPDTVTFVGPSSIIYAIPDTVYLTLPDRIATDFNENISIIGVESNLVSHAPQEVNVRFEVASFLRQTTVVDVKPMNFPADSSMVLLDRKVEVIYTVQDEMAGAINEEDFNILADFNRFDRADSTITPILDSNPDFILDLKINPEKLRVEEVMP